MDNEEIKKAEDHLKSIGVNNIHIKLGYANKISLAKLLADFLASELECKCENSTWDKDVGCLVCDDCGETI